MIGTSILLALNVGLLIGYLAGHRDQIKDGAIDGSFMVSVVGVIVIASVLLLVDVLS